MENDNKEWKNNWYFVWSRQFSSASLLYNLNMQSRIKYKESRILNKCWKSPSQIALTLMINQMCQLSCRGKLWKLTSKQWLKRLWRRPTIITLVMCKERIFLGPCRDRDSSEANSYELSTCEGDSQARMHHPQRWPCKHWVEWDEAK